MKLIDYFKDIFIDKLHNRHRRRCQLLGRRFTVIDNAVGSKVWECHVKYCPCCGERLKK